MTSNVHLFQANIGMGLDHQSSLTRGIQSMGAYFLSSNPDFFRKNAEVQSYIDYIRKENPDILYLTEVCGEEQRDSLVESLEQSGYQTHVIKGFELWNMQEESHRYLYHILGVRGDFTHKSTIQQYTANPLVRFMKRRNGLGKGVPPKNEQVGAILDGGGSQYSIGDIEIGLLHAHANDTTQVFEGLAKNLAQSKDGNIALVGDMNMQTTSSDALMERNNPDLNRLPTRNTYPYYFSQAGGGVLTRAIGSVMKKNFLPHPDQIYINPGVQVVSQKTLGPTETGLRSDHAVNHLVYRTTSQSAR